MTSFDVVAYLRGILKTRKIGHTGTLDPAAVGVLPVCVGNATKAIEYITDKDKLYRAELTLGIKTDTQDSSGNILEIRKPDIKEKQILETVNGFKGKYNQTPPMYSAVRVEGKKLYELARSGITIERKSREVEIYNIGVLKIQYGTAHLKESTPTPVIKVLMDVECSKGTYIRTLCEDIGERLGCGGHMSFLVRMSTGKFMISDSKTLEEIKGMVEAGNQAELFTDIASAFEEMEKVVLNATEEKRFLNGLPIPDENLQQGKMLRIYSSDGSFIAIGEIILREGKHYLKSKKLFL